MPVCVPVKTEVSGALLVVCTVQQAVTQAVVSFHRLSPEGGQLQRLTEATDMDGFAAEQVTFQLQAQITLKIELDNSKPTDCEWPCGKVQVRIFFIL